MIHLCEISTFYISRPSNVPIVGSQQFPVAPRLLEAYRSSREDKKCLFLRNEYVLFRRQVKVIHLSEISTSYYWQASIDSHGGLTVVPNGSQTPRSSGENKKCLFRRNKYFLFISLANKSDSDVRNKYLLLLVGLQRFPWWVHSSSQWLLDSQKRTGAPRKIKNAYFC